MWKLINFVLKYIIYPVAWMLAWSPGSLTGRFVIPLSSEAGSVWLNSLEYITEFPNNSEIRHWDVRVRASVAWGFRLLAHRLSIAKTLSLHSFYLGQSFKSFWLNVWIPSTKMPTRSPDTDALHTHTYTPLFKHLWSTQLSDCVEPWPFRMSQVGKKAAYIFLCLLLNV